MIGQTPSLKYHSYIAGVVLSHLSSGVYKAMQRQELGVSGFL